MTETFEITVLADQPVATEGSWSDGQPYLASEEIERVLGWELKIEGLCKGDSCIPLGDNINSDSEGAYNLSQIADLVGRPTLTDEAAGIVAIGQPYNVRSAALTQRIAPDFSLPDISGVDRALSDWAGKKRLLVAFSSW
tara:strand:+ start:148 stop:564 length:417 start_codon:yes stop_codon:yes gene_type:complete